MRSIILILFPLFFLSCTKKQESKTLSEINLAIWGNYLSPEVQKKFTEETGIKINITNYSSNEELLAKMQMGSSGIDMAVPSDYMVDIMIKLNLLEPLDSTRISNFKNLSPKFLAQPFDPTNKFSLPYAWTTTGVAVNRSIFKGNLKGWKDIFENPELKGKFSLLDDGREVIATALRMHGHSINTTNVKELQESEETLLKVKPNVKTFTSDTIDLLKNKEVALAQSFSSDALQAQAQSNGEIEFILPSDGGTRSIDNMVIVKGSKHKENVLKLMDYMLRTENNLIFVKKVRCGPVLTTTRALLPEDLKNNKALFPSEEQFRKLEQIRDLGKVNELYEAIWTKIKTH
ncbi:MAG: ABC transporter substrate-binding protein [Pseudobdellovibrionaceae bacterium]